MKDIMTTNEPYELQDFCFICKRHIEAAGNVLSLQWIPMVQAVFLQVKFWTHVQRQLFYAVESDCLKSVVLHVTARWIFAIQIFYAGVSEFVVVLAAG